MVAASTSSANTRRRVTACATVKELHHGRQCLHQGPHEVATVQEKFLRHTAVVKRFSSLGRAFLGAPGQGQARWLLGVLLVLCLAVGGLQVLISYAARDFTTALVNRNAVAFYHNLWR